jgi:hypothetical protein
LHLLGALVEGLHKVVEGLEVLLQLLMLLLLDLELVLCARLKDVRADVGL